MQTETIHYDESVAPFFEGVAAGELRLQFCEACERFMWPVKYRCAHCFAPDVVWRTASGRAVLYSRALVHQSYPGFESPYVVATVETEEGVRFNTGLVGDRVEDVEVGSPLVLHVDPEEEPFPIPRFRRAS